MVNLLENEGVCVESAVKILTFYEIKSKYFLKLR